MKRSVSSGIIIGFLVVVFGVLALLKILFGWPFNHLFEIILALIFICVSVTSIIQHGFRFWSVIFLLIGASMLSSRIGYWGRFSFRVSASLIIVALGIYIIVHATSNPHFKRGFDDEKYAGRDSGDYARYSVSFSNISASNDSKCFKGGYASATFGTLRLDLSNIQLNENAVLNVSASFGTLEIKLPRNIPYKTDVTPVFGSFVNYAPPVYPVPGEFFLEIKGSAAFGKCLLV